MKKIIKTIKSYFVSKDIWKAKMDDPVLPRRPCEEEVMRIKEQTVLASGFLKDYANPSLISQEKEAWSNAIREKHTLS